MPISIDDVSRFFSPVASGELDADLVAADSIADIGAPWAQAANTIATAKEGFDLLASSRSWLHSDLTIEETREISGIDTGDLVSDTSENSSAVARAFGEIVNNGGDDESALSRASSDDDVSAGVDINLKEIGYNDGAMSVGPSGNLNGTELVDSLSGNNARNTIQGLGGADILTGGEGEDTFEFSAIAHFGDTITDFKSGSDRFVFDHAGIAGLDTTLRFDAGAAPTHEGASFYFNAADHKLYYDEDGTGTAHTGIVVATIQTGGAIVASDIDII